MIVRVVFIDHLWSRRVLNRSCWQCHLTLCRFRCVFSQGLESKQMLLPQLNLKFDMCGVVDLHCIITSFIWNADRDKKTCGSRKVFQYPSLTTCNLLCSRLEFSSAQNLNFFCTSILARIWHVKTARSSVSKKPLEAPRRSIPQV